MTITPEERAEWRQAVVDGTARGYFHGGSQDVPTSRLLDALDAAEARAEQAERERNVLAKVVTGGANGECPYGWDTFCPHPDETWDGCDGRPAYKCWLAYARQEAAKREEEK